jgi:stage II sporulation protein AA (anti-sigma F factor antagonist)
MSDVAGAHLDIDVDGGRVRVVVTGEIDLFNAADIEARLLAEITNETTAVELDVTDVRYIDSAGLRVIFSLTTLLRRSQTDLRIVALPRTPARFAIEVSGMATICPLEPPAA